MDKRSVLRAVWGGAAAYLAASTAPVHAQHAPKTVRGPVLLTLSGAIDTHNRGPLDPALDQMMAKQKLAFDAAYAFDYAALTALRASTIRPTLEYDATPHQLRGPLLAEVLKAADARLTDKTTLLLRAVDGYAAELSVAEMNQRRFMVATHLDGRPLSLGSLGPLWAVYDADRFADMAARPVTERFAKCPWALYSVEVKS